MSLEKLVASNIRRFRLQNKLTQEELASRCGMPTSYIGMIETYRKIPKLPNIERIAQGLGIDPTELLKPLEGNPRKSQIQGVSEEFQPTDPVLAEILEIIKRNSR